MRESFQCTGTVRYADSFHRCTRVSENSHNACEDAERKMDSQCPSSHAHGRYWVAGDLTSFLRVREGEETLLLGVLVIVKMY